MDRHVLPRVTYWTGTWDPAREAISKEIDTLRRLQTPPAPVVAFSAGNRTALDVRNRVVTLAGRRWMVFRTCAALCEPMGEVTHAFGRVNAWPIFRSLGRRPFVFTAVAPGPPLEPAMYKRATVFVAESETLATILIEAGVRREAIHIIYPGVDLAQFAPTAFPPPPFRLLFASSPAEPQEIESRGVGLLVELARRHADIEVVALWRNWGQMRQGLDAIADLSPPDNFRIEELGSRSMADVYGSVHATACLFSKNVGKSCPNSVIEGLACGRPTLIANTCGIAHLIASKRAGVAAPRALDALSDALATLRSNHQDLSAGARVLAEEQFDVRDFCRKYVDIYSGLARDRRAVPAFR